MKKLITFVFCTILILSLTACVSSTKEAEDTTMSDSEAVQLPNPFQECQSLEKAAELAGFEILFRMLWVSIPNARYASWKIK